MPPKQKQAKKGPVYKAAIPLKDIVPVQIKQPPRQPKPFRIPQSFPESSKNNQTLANVFEQWPSQQAVKAYDFGINSQAVFQDTVHEDINSYLKDQGKMQWKRLIDISYANDFNNEDRDEVKMSKGEIQSMKSIDKKIEQEQQERQSCVIETFMRPQTEQQTQRRLKDQAEKAQKAAKDKKKAAKKQQVKEQGPISVSDVMMQDVISGQHLGQISKWIGSQLQIIKQRNLTDIVSSEPIWKKIYPQQNGVPQLSKSGKYWVKLLYMGKYIKIQVDDRVPLNQQQAQLFPISAKPNQKWTGILTKALVKYLAKTSNDHIIGNGIIIYALTGMISETLSLNSFEEWQLIQQFLSNQHYISKDIVLGCYSTSNKEFRRAPKKQRQVKEQGHQGYQQTGIKNGYSYCIGDYFDNDVFNMVFSQQKTQEQMMIKHEYNQLCKVSISNKTRQQKLQYRKKKKQLKEKLGIQQKKRLQLISKTPIRYHFLKLLAGLELDCQYNQKQILLAKKCALNKLSQPPNYDIPTQKDQKNQDKNQDTKSIQSLSVTVIKYKQESELFPNIHDFSQIPNIQQLLQRKDSGVWIQSQDLFEFFEEIQIVYNPNVFTHKTIQSVIATRSNQFTFDQNKEILVVEKVQQEEEKEDRKVNLLFGYSYQKSPTDAMTPYTLLQKFDFDVFRATSSVVRLDKNLSSKLLSLKNQNTVFKLYTVSQGNYNYWISADSPFKLLSIADYLTEFQGYTKKTLNCEYPPIQAGTYFPILRLRIRQEKGQNKLLVKLTNVPQDLIPHLNFRLATLNGSQQPLTSQQQEGVIQRRAQRTLLVYEYSRIVIEQNYQYYLIVEAQSQENIPDGAIQLMILSKEDSVTIEQREQVEPVKFIEKYNPNKYGLICRQRIFCNNDCSASLTVKLGQFQQGQASLAAKGAKKGGKDESVPQLIDKPYTANRTILLKITNGQNILYQASGINEINIPNFKFNSTKASGKQYFIQTSFDLRKWPQAASLHQETSKICWVLQIVSEQSVALVRDTRQEDRQKQIRKSWEDAQPGRAERAKKARKRYLAQVKKENGQALTEQEEQLLSAPRLTKRQQLEQAAKQDDKKGGKGGKKDDKKTGKDAKKEQIIQEKAPERQPPKSADNFTNELKQFLKILQNREVRFEKLQSNQQPRIRSQQQLRAIRQGALMASQNRVGQLIRNIEKRQTMKIKQKEKTQTLNIFYSQSKSSLKLKYDEYIQWRNEDTQRDSSRQQKQRVLIDVISQQKPTISEADLTKNINDYRQINGHNPQLADVADMVRKNIRIGVLSQKISTALTGWQVQQLKNIREEIKNDRVEGIQQGIMKQFTDMLDEAQKNPALVAEKQAEAKKGGKKGGKK